MAENEPSANSNIHDSIVVKFLIPSFDTNYHYLVPIKYPGMCGKVKQESFNPTASCCVAGGITIIEKQFLGTLNYCRVPQLSVVTVTACCSSYGGKERVSDKEEKGESGIENEGLSL